MTRQEKLGLCLLPELRADRRLRGHGCWLRLPPLPGPPAVPNGLRKLVDHPERKLLRSRVL